MTDASIPESRVFEFILESEHCPSDKPRKRSKRSHDRSNANNSEANTGTLAQHSVSATRVSNRAGGREVDRSSEEAWKEWGEGCLRYSTRLSAWLASFGALFASLVTDRPQAWPLACEPSQRRSGERSSRAFSGS